MQVTIVLTDSGSAIPRGQGRLLAAKFGIMSPSNLGSGVTIPVGIKEELNAYLRVQIQANTDPVVFWQVRK